MSACDAAKSSMSNQGGTHMAKPLKLPSTMSCGRTGRQRAGCGCPDGLRA